MLPEDKEKFIRLICRVKGIKVYDDTKKFDTDVKIKIEDVELVIREVLTGLIQTIVFLMEHLIIQKPFRKQMIIYSQVTIM